MAVGSDDVDTQRDWFDYRENVILKMAAYRQDPKPELLREVEDWYAENKEALCERHHCKCGGIYSIQYLKQHRLTKRHHQYLVSQGAELPEWKPMVAPPPPTERHSCPCGGKYNDRTRRAHFKTKSHIHFMVREEMLERAIAMMRGQESED